MTEIQDTIARTIGEAIHDKLSNTHIADLDRTQRMAVDLLGKWALKALHDAGHVVMPREPTVTMVDAGEDVLVTTLCEVHWVPRDLAASVFRAMSRDAWEKENG